VGPLTTTQKNYKYAVVAIKYFTKWVEPKSLVNIAVAGLKGFFWQNIIYHFRVPLKIIIDNIKQYDCHIFKDFYHQIVVEATFTSVYHPQSNRAVERANTLIFSAIKKPQRSIKGQMGRGITESYVEPQHIRLLSNKLRVVQATIWRGAGNTGRDKILKREKKAGGHLES
jgi:hypothetical protein